MSKPPKLRELREALARFTEPATDPMPEARVEGGRG